MAQRACVNFNSFVARSLVYLGMNQNVNFNSEMNPNEIGGFDVVVGKTMRLEVLRLR